MPPQGWLRVPEETMVASVQAVILLFFFCIFFKYLSGGGPLSDILSGQHGLVCFANILNLKNTTKLLQKYTHKINFQNLVNNKFL